MHVAAASGGLLTWCLLLTPPGRWAKDTRRNSAEEKFRRLPRVGKDPGPPWNLKHPTTLPSHVSPVRPPGQGRGSRMQTGAPFP
uniref:Secreted protein n=1 Tax=Pan troglodytes TaxID=9598 RepID=G2HEE9_PANTR|nr:hypothetical protein [Pan troglodytes]